MSLPTYYQDYIHLSKYSRFNHEDSRREDWDETVNRYFDFFQKYLKNNCDYDLTPEQRDILSGSVKYLEAMPSMRALMTAGPALEISAAAAYNCFSADTTFITDKGVRSFAETVGTTVNVLNRNNEFVPAEVKSFGRQKLNRVVLRHGRGRHTSSEVHVTPDHAWVTINRGLVNDLRVGDQIPSNANYNPTPVNLAAWIAGFGFGDGTIDADGNARVRLCGKKAKNVRIFEMFGHCRVYYPPSYNGDPVVVFRPGMFSDWKNLPNDDASLSYLASWLNGYMEADGHNDITQPGISSQDREAMDFVRRIAASVGLIVTGDNTSNVMETNFGPRSNPLVRLTLREHTTFYVTEIEPYGEDEVFCVVEPETHTFTLANGALTRNCSYMPINHYKRFDEMMYLLSCGSGVGFSVEDGYISQLPEFPEKIKQSKKRIVVGDSKIGWAESIRKLFECLYDGVIPVWDDSLVRPKGSVLKTFGGRASGPEPLREVYKFIVKTAKKAKGRKLTDLECHDICCVIADAIVSGGVRRSALISLSDLTSKGIRDAKTGDNWIGNGHRALSNNSTVYNEKPSLETFMEEWTALVRSKSGERGIVSRVAMGTHINYMNEVRRMWFGDEVRTRQNGYMWGCNPCCVSGVTPILTSEGYYPIKNVVGETISIWNGESFESVVPYEAGVADLYRVTFSDGTHLDCTANHRFCIEGLGFVETQDLIVGQKLQKFDMPVIEEGQDLCPIDAYSQGFYSGDGCEDSARSYVYDTKEVCIGRLTGRFFPRENNRFPWVHGDMWSKNYVPIDASLGYRLNWLAGLLDADGTVCRYENGKSLQLASVNLQFLDELRLMLTTLGVQAKVVHAREAGSNLLPDGRGGMKEYDTQEVRRILINCVDTRKLQELGLKTERLDLSNNNPNRNASRFVKVDSIIDLGRIEMTYCFTEPKTNRGTFNGIVTGNSEIILRPFEQCNLTEVVVRPEDNLETLKGKVIIATILGTFQSTVTHYDYLSDEWKHNAEDERLLGVSLTGIYDHPVMRGDEGQEKLIEWLSQLKWTAIATNREWADKLGIPHSTAITCIKPSGTVSQLVNASSGMHGRYAKYYIRTVRENKISPIATFMQDMGIPSEPDVMKPDDRLVFSFPIKSPESSALENSKSAIEQLELWKTYQIYWAEHKPSITVYVDESEWFLVGDWVYRNFDFMSGVSFLPKDEHTYAQAPYQEITEEEYNDLLSKMPESIDWSLLNAYETDDTTESAQTLACSGSFGCEF